MIHILQTMFHIMFLLFYPSSYIFSWQTYGLPETRALISTECLFCLFVVDYFFCIFFLGPFLDQMLYVSQGETGFVRKKRINLFQAIHQILFVLLHVVCCSSGVMHNLYLFSLLKLLIKQEMTIPLRRWNLGDIQMFILHYFSLTWQFP